ncbi:MAG: AraC family transcriptional regulator [Saonia sp.]
MGKTISESIIIPKNTAMPIDYQDIFYNHFEQQEYKVPPHYKKEENFLMRYKARFANYEFHENCLTVIYFKQGNGELIKKNRRLKAKDDQFLILNPNEGWEFVNKENKYIDVLSFGISCKLASECDVYLNLENGKLLDDPFDKTAHQTFFLEKMFSANYFSTGDLLRHIYNTSLLKDYRYMDAEELTMEVLRSISQNQMKAYALANKIKAQKSSTKVETFKRLLSAYEYIHDNIAHAISLDELSQVSSLSKFHLYDSFKNVYGKTPHQYINRIKVAKAKEQIQSGDFSIGEISDSFGFSDLCVFTKIFKKAYGNPPSYYQKRP